MGKQGLDLDGTQENRGTGSQTGKKKSVKIQEGEAWLVMKMGKNLQLGEEAKHSWNHKLKQVDRK